MSEDGELYKRTSIPLDLWDLHNLFDEAMKEFPKPQYYDPNPKISDPNDHPAGWVITSYDWSDITSYDWSDEPKAGYIAFYDGDKVLVWRKKWFGEMK